MSEETVLYEPFRVLHRVNKIGRRFLLEENTTTFLFDPVREGQAEVEALKHILDSVLKYFKYRFKPSFNDSVAIVFKGDISAWMGLRRSEELTANTVLQFLVKKFKTASSALSFMLAGPIDITFAHVTLLETPDFV